MIRTIIFCCVPLTMTLLVSPRQAMADNPAVWNISEATTGNDVFWTSPTAVDLGFPRYLTAFEITRVEVFTIFGGSDVTDMLGDTTGAGFVDALPVTLIDDTISEPTTGTAATVNVGIDSSGFGQSSFTDVTLGTIFLLPITRIEVDTTVMVQGVVPGDFDTELNVDWIDLGQWETSFSVDAGADTNNDNRSDGFDFLDWQAFLGNDLSPIAAVTVETPEPSSGLCVMIGAVLMACCRRTRFS